MLFFNSEKEKKAKKFSSFNYDSLQEWSLNGKSFYTKILDIYDGDTVTICIKINDAYHRMNCRLFGLDTPELRSNNEEEKIAAKKARCHLIHLITSQTMNPDCTRKEVRDICAQNQQIFWIECYSFDKYGRLLIKISKEGFYINKKMIDDGFAGEYDGKTKGQWTDYFMH